MRELQAIAGCCYFGADPELFLSSSDGAIVGSEKVIPENGIGYVSSYGQQIAGAGNIVRDGISVELHPRPTTCREYSGQELNLCFRKLKEHLLSYRDISVNFKQVVKVSRKELKSLSEASNQFGCNPTNNIYDQMQSDIKVNPKRYLKRSGGGHIHLSSNNYSSVSTALRDPQKMVPVLDVILGNTCVLLDRNPHNKERRKIYGKAGEYRIKNYGLEFRVLSNFWLQSPQLTYFVYGLARTAIHIVSQSNGNDYVSKLMSLVDKEKIFQAIQENNFHLAYENFSKIESFLMEICTNADHFPINCYNIKEFHYFVKKGIDYWFTDDPLVAWTDKFVGASGRGFEKFLSNRVNSEMTRQPVPKKKFTEIWANI